ncbi:hypothetical protein [Paraglaciecola sp.]|uniref:hypothetical protein n=1 Tax=Paraglaciecola sp. TaxID=1920173 RepID=UPI003EF945F6
MSLDNQDKVESTVVDKTSQRRKFLKRASAGVIASSLPTQSVWGYECTVSGAQSGNMSGIAHHKECDLPNFSPGRSPGTWHQFILYECDQHASIDKLHSMFTYVGSHFNAQHDADDSEKAGKRRCIISEVKAVAEHTMNIDSNLLEAGFETKISTALSSSGGLDWNVAAMWLNMYFGLGGYSPASDAAHADSVIEQFLSYLVIQANANQSINLDSLYNFDDDASTSYQPVTCLTKDATTSPSPKKKK